MGSGGLQGMTLPELTMAMWLMLTVLPLWLTMLIAARKIRADYEKSSNHSEIPHPALEVFVPVKGTFPNQREVLNSLLEQSYPCYSVTFILEDRDDPANAVVDALCLSHSHARRIISGISRLCAQKNHNLVQGTQALATETGILLFCDSTNWAYPDWIERLTVPLRAGTGQVVTTFRAFDPRPETLGGVCQAMYAAFLVLLQVNKPTPWGGATAILRDTFDRLKVREAWSNTVVDDLIVGNVLQRAGVRIIVDAAALLKSPLQGQTVPGFLNYLDRQILFPKFTNPGIWIQSVLFLLNVSLAISVTVLEGILYPMGLAGSVAGWLSYGFLLSMVLFVDLLRRMSPLPISPWWWLASSLPCIVLSAYVCMRSVFRNHIDWHGRRYWPGRKGVVKKADFLHANPR
jgi:ceramide glucosyltransferase